MGNNSTQEKIISLFGLVTIAKSIIRMIIRTDMARPKRTEQHPTRRICLCCEKDLPITRFLFNKAHDSYRTTCSKCVQLQYRSFKKLDAVPKGHGDIRTCLKCNNHFRPNVKNPYVRLCHNCKQSNKKYF